MFNCIRWPRLVSILLVLVLLAACGGASGPEAPKAPDAAGSVATPIPPAVDKEPTAAPKPSATAKAPVEEPSAAAEEPAATAQVPKGDDQQPTAGETGEGSTTSGAYVADLGFRPEVDGFSFENYGGDVPYTNLTSPDVQRLFGDDVCASQAGSQCILTPAGQQWLEQANQAMSGGHCEGMAVLSTLLYTGQLNPSEFGAATTFDLQIKDNKLLQQEIAYWFITQGTQPARSTILNDLTPNDVVDKLIETFKAGKNAAESYSIGFYKRNRSGGHAVTPFAVEDRGDGSTWILIYDNNYPNTTRQIEVDRSANTWRYSGSTNPAEAADEYEGDAESKTLELAPIPPRLPKQECPFCDAPKPQQASGTMRAFMAPAEQYNQIWLEGDVDLLITDGNGRRQGFVGGKFVSEIPGAVAKSFKYGVDVWAVDNEPVYYVPVGVDFSITIDGSRLKAASAATVTMIGPGYVLEVSDIKLEPGQVDTLDMSPDGSFLSYKTDRGESPDILLGLETDAADYAFLVKGFAIEPGGAVNLTLDTKNEYLSVDTIGNTQPGTYGLLVARIDDQGEQIFGHDDIGLNPDDIVYVDYLKWSGEGDAMPLEIDRGGDGKVDETVEVTDVTNQINK